MRSFLLGFMGFGLLAAVGCLPGDDCVRDAYQCNDDGDVEQCIEGQWVVQETCQADEVCDIDEGVGSCLVDEEVSETDSM